MNEETQKRYRQLAKNFYKTKINGDVTAQRIVDALVKNAEEYRPDYFRKLKNALAFDQEEKGYPKAVKKIKETKNPVTQKGSKLVKKPKEKRLKSISIKDGNKLILEIKKNDEVLLAAVVLSRELGCRPAELFIVRMIYGEVHIQGAKKSNGNRGLDRIIKHESPIQLAKAIKVLQEFKEKCIKERRKSTPSEIIQARFSLATKSLWPRRATWPTLYTFRHQQGSNLKASGMSRQEIAYIMGHQSTKSIEIYGNKRSEKSKVTIKAAISADKISAVVRENHTAPPSSSPAVAPAADSGGLNF
jgi:hypothetical protein